MSKQSFSIEYNYEVQFTSKVFDPANDILINVLKENSERFPIKVAFAIDSGVLEHHYSLNDSIKAYCEAHNIDLAAEPLVLPGGEPVKNDMNLVFQGLEYIDTAKIDRHAFLIAIGGGAILDMVGLVAAIGHRGIRHIRIPTTVLSQNDSGVGVKNGVNFQGKKNFIGTFAPPVGVICDQEFLTTLSERDWRAGIPEAIKVSLLKDPEFFHWIVDHVDQLNDRNLEVMMELVERCAVLHMVHISTNGDPFEKGSSRPLDFGHWAAHKLEQLTDFDVRHGEAVAIGLAIDNVYAMKKGWLSREACETILNCIQQLGFELFHSQLTDESGDQINPKLIAGLEEFREHLGGELTIMLLDGIGQPREVHEMDHQLIEESILFLKQRN
ncbi:3-dehydroquinate synthase [Marinoscillum pacificum]|uniref:3-dehydroquinate synthase n=1 Tax=Marinoscillum pacificum TaxID=392723 RepID=UPI0021579B82|nr:3-dehydroquinate synthase [Marinoscillum pacificum]